MADLANSRWPAEDTTESGEARCVDCQSPEWSSAGRGWIARAGGAGDSHLLAAAQDEGCGVLG